jgi:hypothetical protein
MSAWRRAVALAALLATVGCGRHAFPWRCGEDRVEGKRLYRGACASCHGRDGRGGGPDAGRLETPPPDLTTLTTRHEGHFPRQYVIDVITGTTEVPAHGTREMPVWSDRFGPGAGHVASIFARRQVELMTDHLQRLQH